MSIIGNAYRRCISQLLTIPLGLKFCKRIREVSYGTAGERSGDDSDIGGMIGRCMGSSLRLHSSILLWWFVLYIVFSDFGGLVDSNLNKRHYTIPRLCYYNVFRLYYRYCLPTLPAAK